jgi:hypothetical protein
VIVPQVAQGNAAHIVSRGALCLWYYGIQQAKNPYLKGGTSDGQVLLGSGVIAKGEDGKLGFPYDEVRLDLVLKPA